MMQHGVACTLSGRKMNQDMPEGFHSRPDGTFNGIPGWAMQEANMIAASFINKREWDVPVLADALYNAYMKGRLDELLSMEKL